MLNKTRRSPQIQPSYQALVEFFAAVLVALLTISLSMPILAKAESIPVFHHSGAPVTKRIRAAADVHLAQVNRITFHHRSFEVKNCDGKTYLAQVRRVSGDRRGQKRTHFSRALSGILRLGGKSGDVVGEFSVAATYSRKERLAVYAQFDVGETSCTLLQTSDHYRIFQRNIPEELGICADTDKEAIAADVQSTTATDSSQAALDGSNAIIDVMVMYSPEARAAAGGTAAIQAEVTSAVAQANQAYANSQIAQQLRLVYTGETSTSENAGGANGGFSTNLSRLQSQFDGYFDEVATLRDQYGADVVSMLIQSDGSYCGLGYLMTSPSSGFAPYAYNVVGRTCISNKSFQHEIGHNMGANHDIANAGGAGAYSYSYGWRFTGNSSTQWRSVMAYSPGTRINYFSNPDISYDGVPTGTTTANNALTLNNTALLMSAFRSTVSSAPIGSAPPPENPTPAPTTAPAISSVAISKLSAKSTGVVLISQVVDSDSVGLAGRAVTLQKYSKSIQDFVNFKSGATNRNGLLKFKVKFKKNERYRAISESTYSSEIKISSSWLRSSSRRR